MDHGTVVIQQPVTQPAMHPTTTAVHNNASSPRSIAVTRGLGIAQIVIGALTVLLAILTTALLHYWVGYIGFGIWGGIWIVIGGILGVVSAGNPTNSCLNGTNMAFAIVSSVLAFIQFIVYCIAVTHYREFYFYCTSWSCQHRANGTGVGLYVVLLLLMIAEFSIALSVAIYCCKGACCTNSGSTGVIIQQQQPVMFQAGGMATSYPVAVSAYPGQQVSYVSTTAAPNTMVMTYNQAPYKPQGFAEPPPYAQ